jgi:hypothetical protein
MSKHPSKLVRNFGLLPATGNAKNDKPIARYTIRLPLDSKIRLLSGEARLEALKRMGIFKVVEEPPKTS